MLVQARGQSQLCTMHAKELLAKHDNNTKNNHSSKQLHTLHGPYMHTWGPQYQHFKCIIVARQPRADPRTQPRRCLVKQVWWLQDASNYTMQPNMICGQPPFPPRLPCVEHNCRLTTDTLCTVKPLQLVYTTRAPTFGDCNHHPRAFSFRNMQNYLIEFNKLGAGALLPLAPPLSRTQGTPHALTLLLPAHLCRSPT